MLKQLIERIKSYAAPKTGRLQAALNFGKKHAEISGEEVRARSPLGEQLGFGRVEVDEDYITALAKKQYKRSPDYKAAKRELGLPDEVELPIPSAPYSIIKPLLLSAVQAKAVRDFGRDVGLGLTEDMIGGKDHIGWVTLPGSRKFNLGEHLWRLPDWLRPQVKALTPKEGLDYASLTLMDEKEALGDGIDGVLQPQLLGLPEDYIGFFQNRSFVEDEQAVIERLFKGIVIVHPGAKNVWAHKDGYGMDVNAGRLHIYEMLEGEQFDPRCRYTLQGLYYNGMQGWWRVLFAIENLKLLAKKDSRQVEDRLMAANAPVKALGGWGIMFALSSLMRLTVPAGRARIALPALAFRYIAGLEDIALIEEEQVRSRVTGRDVAQFYAPQELSSYFRAAGSRSEWAHNRRPDLPPGKCVHRHVLAGFVPFNAFVIPTKSMSLSGLDFDGDMDCVFPTVERGGLYECFNDLPETEREQRLAVSTGDRKGAMAAKTPYESPLARWAGQLEAKVILGMADITARRFLDMGNAPAAWAMEPWIQQAVDRQKRPAPWPHPRGPLFMPRVSHDVLTATDLLRTVQKGVKDDGAGTSFADTWKKFGVKLEQLYLIAKLDVLGQDVYCMNDEFRELMMRWAFELGSRMNDAVSELEVYEKTGVPLMRYENYADQASLPLSGCKPELVPLASTVALLDQHWDQLLEAAKGSQVIRSGFYQLKDGLLDAAQDLGITGELARYARKYKVWRNFATSEQFEEYFSEHPGKRLGDIFCAVDEQVFQVVATRKERDPRTLKDRVVSVTLHNACPVQIGLFRYPQGCVRITKHGGQLRVAVNERAEFDLPRFAFTSAAFTVQDALLGVRLHSVNWLRDEESILHPSQRRGTRVLVAAPAPVSAAAPSGSAKDALLSAFGELGCPAPASPTSALSASSALQAEFDAAWGSLVSESVKTDSVDLKGVFDAAW